jgi:hypothetical protein
MSGCEGCFQTQKALQEALTIVQEQAKQYAINNETNVFIYRTEDGWSFMAEQKARELGVQPTGGVVSYLQPVSA